MWKYNESKHQLEEQPERKYPHERHYHRTDGAGINFLDKEMYRRVIKEYYDYKKSLRNIPCHESLIGKWEDGEEVKETDFDVKTTWVRNTDRSIPTKDDLDLIACSTLPLPQQTENMFNDKLIGKTIRDLPDNFTWDDVFEIGFGIPTGTRIFLKTYFNTPTLKFRE